MTTLGFLIGILTLWAPGVAIATLLQRKTARLNLLECLALGWLFGGGFVSLLLWMAGFVASGVGLQTIVVLGAVGLIIWAALSMRANRTHFFCPRPQSWMETLLVVAIAAEICLIFHAAGGHGLGWDGLLNWEVKARYAFLNNGVLPEAYYQDANRAFTHPGYPLLIPLSELWLYLWMAEPHQFWIKFIFPLYYASGAILLATVAIRLTHHRFAGLLPGVLLFFVPFVTNSPGTPTGGYADFPLGAFYLVANGYLALFLMNGARPSFHICAAAFTLLPWTKQEGAILWTVGMLAVGFVVFSRREHRRLLLYSFAPGLAIFLAWKIFLHAVRVTEGRDFLPVSAVFGHLDRALPLARMVLAEMFEVSRWSIYWPALALAAGYVVFRGKCGHVPLLAATVAAQITLYASTYILSAWPDYSAHFEASFSRLLFQVMPVGWLVIAHSLAPTGPRAAPLPPGSFHQSRSR